MTKDGKYITPYLTREYITREQDRRRLKNKALDINVEKGNMVFLYGVLMFVLSIIGWMLWRR